MKTTFFLLPLLLPLSIFPGCDKTNQQSSSGAAPNAPSAVTDSQDPPDFLNVDESPSIIKKVAASYPEQARTSGLEGKVWVKALVSTDGTVKKAEVIHHDSSSAIFEQSALDAVRQFQFSPAKIKGQPVAVWVSIPFKFSLAEKSAGTGKETGKNADYLRGYIAAKKEALLDLERSNAGARANSETSENIAKLRREVANLELQLKNQ